jgi:hypothetical protein
MVRWVVASILGFSRGSGEQILGIALLAQQAQIVTAENAPVFAAAIAGFFAFSSTIFSGLMLRQAKSSSQTAPSDGSLRDVVERIEGKVDVLDKKVDLNRIVADDRLDAIEGFLTQPALHRTGQRNVRKPTR